MKDLHYSYRLGTSTISYIIRDVCKVIWKCLKDQCMPVPIKERWLAIAKGFQDRSQFPHCIGAIDGKHFRVIKPKLSGSMYYNYKNHFSIQMLAIFDANYCFTYVDIGNYGKDSDSSLFQKTKFYKRLCEKRLDIPEPEYISRKQDFLIPYVLVGDEAFGLSSTVMRPYGGKYLSVNKRIFNYRLTRARRFIECLFGILTNKWRIFHRPLNVNLDLANDIIKAGVILHNFVRMRDGFQHKDTLSFTGLLDNTETEQPDTVNYVGPTPIHIREYLTAYFQTEEGEVPWQYSKI
ncbi:hypothetical protein PGB90_002311 [Kerria lacca]